MTLFNMVENFFLNKLKLDVFLPLFFALFLFQQILNSAFLSEERNMVELKIQVTVKKISSLAFVSPKINPIEENMP